MSNMPATTNGAGVPARAGFQGWVTEAITQKIAAVLPRHLTGERFARLVLGEAVRNPKLTTCTPGSLVSCLLTAAQLGLEPSSPLGHVYLIPRDDRRRGVTDCTLLIGYKGLAALALRSGQLARLDAAVVYEGEPFVVRRGLHPDLIHDVGLDVERTPDRVVAAYAVAVTKDGASAFEVLTRRDIDARRARSQARDSGPWVTDYAAMARKSALRALLNGGLVPMSAELAETLATADPDEPPVIDVSPEPAPRTGRSRAAALLDDTPAPEPVVDPTDAHDAPPDDVDAAPPRPATEPERAAREPIDRDALLATLHALPAGRQDDLCRQFRVSRLDDLDDGALVEAVGLQAKHARRHPSPAGRVG